MNPFLQLLFYALLAVAAENVFFTGGIGLSRVLRAARRPKALLLAYSALLSGFTLICTLLSAHFSEQWAQGKDWIFVRPAIFAVMAAVIYLLTAFVFKTWLPKIYQKIDQTLSSSAINCVVLSVPFLQSTLKMNLAQSAGFAVGTGVAFLLAVLIFSQAMVKFQASDMPKAFCGLPAVFLYIGILSMAFLGFTGGKFF